MSGKIRAVDQRIEMVGNGLVCPGGGKIGRNQDVVSKTPSAGTISSLGKIRKWGLSGWDVKIKSERK